jgi:N-acetylglucosaminyl-diphospho-decaprenol L-rhamnosyltransferase
VSTHVAVAIVGYDNLHDVVRCIDALATSTYDDFEIAICENGGKRAYEALCATLSTKLPRGQKITLVEAPANRGYANGINICIAASQTADAWWLLNPDTEVSPGAMAALVARLEQGDVHAVGGTLYFANGRVQSFGGIWRGWLARAVSIGNGSVLGAVPDMKEVERKLTYLSGASMLVGRAFVERTGPMSEDFFLYCEEVDWCLRAADCGLKLGFSFDAQVLHRQGTTTGSSTVLKTRSWLSVYLDERNKMLITKGHFPARLPIAATAALLLIAMRYLRKGAFRQFGYGVSGWLAGLRGERGAPPSV